MALFSQLISHLFKRMGGSKERDEARHKQPSKRL